MKKLTTNFNAVTVNKGETFEIDLIGGGFVGARWDAEVVSGKATLLNTQCHSDGAGCAMVTEKRVFRAEEAGEIEIVAKCHPGMYPSNTCTFKVKVN
ncbi:MAG: hypothetical protein HY052_06300 [Proteobacteria bacterium]|nr:hypothetical protein [Pseudomonadota bacterium]